MAAQRKDHAIFEEDQVSLCVDNIYRCGLVLESAEYMSSEDEEDDDLFQRVTTGTVRVAWHPDGTEEVIPETKLKLEDRSLMPGDVVRRLIQGEDSQRGYVTCSQVICHLQVLGTNYVIKDIDSKSLKPFEQWELDPGDVYLDSWVGRINSVEYKLHLKLPDGTKFSVDQDDEVVSYFEDVTEKRDIDSEFYLTMFYENQHLKARRKNLTKLVIKDNPKYQWPRKKSDQTEYILTVEKVEIMKMDVHWMCHGYAKNTSFDGDSSDIISHPPRKLDKEHIARLKSLNCFASCSLQMGDKAMYTIQPEDTVQHVDAPSKPLLHHIMQGDISNTDGAAGGIEMEENKKNLSHNDVCNGLGTTVYGCNGGSAGDMSSAGEVIGEAIFNLPHNGGSDSKENSEVVNGGSVLGKNTTEKSSATSPPVNSNSATIKDRSNKQDASDSKNKGTKSKSDKQSAKKVTRDKSITDSGDSDSTDSEVELDGPGRYRFCAKLLQGLDVSEDVVKEEPQGSIPPVSRPQPGQTVAVELIYSRSVIDLIWQDGSREEGIRSSVLYPMHHLDELEFFPGDFVISSADNSDSNEYGVVESVQHCERTCMVKWMESRQVDGSDRWDDVKAEAVEMSVYDIKDHSDYKYRPGQVVVRVGGYQDGDTSDAAGGQVYELGQDGRILVQWADSIKSYCRPEEIYSIYNELSEFNDSLDDSESDVDVSDDNSDGEWVTDEEIEEDADDPDNMLNTYSVLCVEASQKIDLDQTMDATLSSLEKLEESLDETPPHDYIPHILEELLRIHQQCKLLDKSLKTTYFRDGKLMVAVHALRCILDSEREERVLKRARDLYHANTGRAATTDKTKLDKASGSESSGAVKNPDVTGVQNITTVNQFSSTLESLRSFDDNLKLLELLQDFLEMDSKTKVVLEKCKDITQKSNKVKDIKTGETAEDVSDAPWWVQYIGESALSPVILVARMTCKFIHIQLSKVRSDLLLKWDELKKCGKLKVLEAMEEEEGEGESDNVTDQDPDGSSVDPLDFHVGSSWQPLTPIGRADLKLDLGDNARSLDMIRSPITPQTPADVRDKLDFNREGFIVEEDAPIIHRFFPGEHTPSDPKVFLTAVRKEMKMLKNGLPHGIFVKGFSDRMDLYTVMMLGPTSTPYEDGLFFFEIQLPNDYPVTPPRVHYLAYCTDRLNPNLYEDGKVCVSLLGTWTGRGTEVWTSTSSLLQVLISIQGLILVAEPYYNEAGYEKQKGSQHGQENSHMYNEMAILKMVESMTRLCENPPSVYNEETKSHMNKCADRMMGRLQHWLDSAGTDQTVAATNTASGLASGSNTTGDSMTCDDTDKDVAVMAGSIPIHSDCPSLPDFPLFPLSKGFQITLKKLLAKFKSALCEHG